MVFPLRAALRRVSAPLCAGLLLTALAYGARDWARYPAVTEISGAEEVFAIGDAHSDFIRLARAMAAAGIIEKQPSKPQDAKWCAGRSVLVTTGDMVDKGPRALDVLRLLMWTEPRN